MPYTDSAGVKLNKNADLIIEANKSGDVISARNLINGIEYVGGSNPNRVQVIQGTLENIFDNIPYYVLSDFGNYLLNGTVSALITIDGTDLGYDLITIPVYANVAYSNAIFADGVSYYVGESGNVKPPVLSVVIQWVWQSFFSLEVASVVTWANESTVSVVDIKPYASQIPTTLTIYWHPMPE